jgi:DNA-binding helix-hairpin-helix protein with protein kinase domain
MIYRGQTGLQYDLPATPIKKGGEAKIYNVNGKTNVVAKIYKPDKISAEKEIKLKGMIDDQPEKEILKFLAWPQDILYLNGRFAGFIMSKMSVNEDLNVIYECGSAKYARMPWEDKIMIARNICRLLGIIHRSPHSCGDLNPRNISVDPKTNHVVFLDTDSYHIQDENNTYRCDVGIPEYLPVEIQKKMQGGVTLATAPAPTFSHDTDNFALAIHIFQLLMNGTHPFACTIVKSHPSETTPQRLDNILRGDFPFMTNKSRVKIPLYAPKITVLTKSLQDLFKRAFIDGHNSPSMRPKPSEWYDALGELRQNLVKCKKVAHHQFYNNLKTCPWCEIDNAWNPPTPTYSVSFYSIGKGSLTAKVNGISITSVYTGKHGEDVVFTATPNYGYRVKQWTNNNSNIYGNKTNSYSLKITTSADISVEFEEDTYIYSYDTDKFEAFLRGKFISSGTELPKSAKPELKLRGFLRKIFLKIK